MALHNCPRIIALGILFIEMCRKNSKRYEGGPAETMDGLINSHVSSGLDTASSVEWPDLQFLNKALIEECGRGLV